MTTEPEINFYFFAEDTYIKSIGTLLQQIYSQSQQNSSNNDIANEAELNIKSIKIPLNNRIFMLCSSASQMRQYDEALWTYAQLSFLPHATEKDPMLDKQYIVLGTSFSAMDKSGGNFRILLCTPEAWTNLVEDFSSIISGIQKIIVPIIAEKYSLEEHQQKIASQHLKLLSRGFQSANIFYRDAVTNSWVKTACYDAASKSK